MAATEIPSPEKERSNPMKKLKIGVLGLAEVSQITHIPVSAQLPALFDVTDLYDPAPAVAQKVAAIVGARTHATPEALIASDVDAVLVVGPNASHAPWAVGALKAGKHVMIEKPMCMGLAEAEAIAAAQGDRVVLVAYMRRYAPSFETAVARVAPRRGEITFARIRDFIGMNPLFIDPTFNVAKGEVPAALKAAMAAAEATGIQALAGTTEGDRAMVANLLLGLSTHDLSAMREMLGMPKRVLSAHARKGGLFITAQFDYGDFICQFETGVDHLARFDARVEVLLPDETVEVIWDTPYIRHQPARLRVTAQNTAQGVTVSEGYPSRQDSFVPQWERFHAAITQGAPVKTSIADAMEDHRLIEMILARLEP